MEKKHICCICGKEFEGWGNNLDGYVDPFTLKIVEWGAGDRCCDDCNMQVIAGRLLTMKAGEVFRGLDFEVAEDGKAQLRSLASCGEISSQMHDFILANWDLFAR